MSNLNIFLDIQIHYPNMHLNSFYFYIRIHYLNIINSWTFISSGQFFHIYKFNNKLLLSFVVCEI